MPGHRTPRLASSFALRDLDMNTTGSFAKLILLPSVLLTVIISIVFSNQVPPSQAFNQVQYKFQNPDLPVEERIDNILSLMTLDEKNRVSRYQSQCAAAQY